MAAVFLTKKELAERKRVTTRTVERWMSRGEGPPYTRHGRRALFSVENVEAWERASTFPSRVAELANRIS
ncbi:MAG: hypothetical protein NVS2B5_05760 [Beijerinckiaceae bacterium]